MVNKNKIFHRDIDVSDGVVVIVSELCAGLHHIEHRYGKLACNGVSYLFLFAGLLL